MKRTSVAEVMAYLIVVILLVGSFAYYYQLHKHCKEVGGLVLRGTVTLMCVKDGKEV